MTKVMTCRVCGCTDDRACEGGCYWIEPRLCSACSAAKGHKVRRDNTRHFPMARCSCGWFVKGLTASAVTKRGVTNAMREHLKDLCRE